MWMESHASDCAIHPSSGSVGPAVRWVPLVFRVLWSSHWIPLLAGLSEDFLIDPAGCFSPSWVYPSSRANPRENVRNPLPFSGCDCALRAPPSVGFGSKPCVATGCVTNACRKATSKGLEKVTPGRSFLTFWRLSLPEPDF